MDNAISSIKIVIVIIVIIIIIIIIIIIGLDVVSNGHNIKWDQFDILAKGKTDYHCKIKETLYIQELEPAFNVNVGSEKLMLY